MAFFGNENIFSAEKLKLGESGIIVGHGNSMTPILKNGQACRVVPVVEGTVLEKNDIVFCKVKGSYYLHKIIAIKNNVRYQIGNNHGKINGWIGRDSIFGKVVEIL